MSYQIYNPEPGKCTCLVGDPRAGSVPVPVKMISAGGVLLDGCGFLKCRQFVYTTVKISDGPSLALSGTVVSLEDDKPLIQWTHDGPKEAARAADALQKHFASSVVPQDDKSRALVFAGKKLDLEATLRSRAKVVRSRDLASKLDTVQILDMQAIKDLIRDAVEEAMTFLGSALEENERKRLLEEAEASFKERLRLFESQKAGLEERAKVLQAELEKARSLLQEERSRVVSANQFTVSDAGMVELEQRLGRILDHALTSGKADAGLEAEMRGIVARLLDDERQKIREQAEQAQSERIALLEKKVQRLASSLESTEKERDRAQHRAQALEAAGSIGLANVIKGGIGDEDPDREKKLHLMKEIVEFNRGVRHDLEKAGRLPRRRPVASAPPAGSGPLPAGGSLSESGPAGPKVGEAQAPPDTTVIPEVPEMVGSPDVGDVPGSRATPGVPSSRGEERGIAEALGIHVARPAASAGEAPAGAAAAGEEAGEAAAGEAAGGGVSAGGTSKARGGRDTEVIATDEMDLLQVADSPTEMVDPDDLPWEPPGDFAESMAGRAAIRRPGR